MIIWLFESAVVTGALALVIAVGCRWAQPRPAVRHGLWVAVLVKALLPPLVAWPWSLDLHWGASDPVAFTSVVSLEDRNSDRDRGTEDGPLVRTPLGDDAEVPGPVAPGSRLDSLSAAPVQGATPSPGNGVGGGLGSVDPGGSTVAEAIVPEGNSWVLDQGPGTAFGSPGSEAEPTVSDFGAAGWLDRIRIGLPWAWVLGALLLAGLHGVRAIAMGRMLRRSEPAEPQLIAEVDEIAERLGVRPPRVRRVTAASGPFVCGLLRPTLYWTGEGTPGACPVARRTVLTHELAHLRRRDPLYAWLDVFAGIVLWWNPIARWARKSMRDAAEAACDAWVVHIWPADRRGYAEALLDVSRQGSALGPRTRLAARSAAGRAFEGRLCAILGGDAASPRLGRVGAGAILLLLTFWIPAWAAGPGAEAPSEDEVSPERVAEEEKGIDPRALEDPASIVQEVAPRDARDILAEEVERMLDRIEEQAPGSAVAVAVLRGDERLARGVRGEFDGLPMHPRTRVPVGSLSHVFCASYLTLLDRTEQIDLDAELGSIRAEWGDDPELSGVRVRHLLGHTSGLLAEGPSSGDPIEDVRRASTERAPGLGFRYWPSGIAALARVVEASTGTPWAEGIEESFLEPLGLCSTGYGVRDESLGVDTIAFGMHSSLEDLSRFVAVQIQARSPEPLSAEALLELQVPAQIDGDWLNPRSLAWAQSWSEGTEEYLHWSSRRGADSCFVGFSKGHKVGVVILARGAGGLEGLGRQLVARAVGEASATRDAWMQVLDRDLEGALPRLVALTEAYPDDSMLWFRRGYAELGTGLCRPSIRSFERSIELGARRAHAAYNLGCAHARLGEVDRAFEWIHVAIESGFQNETLLAFDPDLDGLRGDPRFGTIRIADY